MLLGVAGLVFGLAYACLQMPRGGERIAPIWLPNGVALAIIWLRPRREWLAVALAAFVGDVAANLAVGDSLSVAAILGAGNTAEFLGAAITLRAVVGPSVDMFRVRPLRIYVGVTAAWSALNAAAASLALGLPLNAAGLAGLATWATADFAGLLIIGPCLVVLVKDRREEVRRMVGPNGWPLLLLAAVAVAAFSQMHMPMNVAVLAALMFVTWRLNVAGAAAGILMTLAIALVTTLMGAGPYGSVAGHGVTEKILALQVFLAVCFYMTLPVAAQIARDRILRGRLSLAVQEAQEAEGRYRLIADRAHDIIVRADLEGRILYVSPSCRNLGYGPEELVGRLGTDLVHPEDRDRYLENTRQLAGPEREATTPRDRRHRFRRKDGGYVWLEGNPTLLLDEHGEPSAILNVFRDISDRVAIEEALAESEAQFRLLAESVTDIVMQTGRDGRLTYISPSCLAVTGYTQAECLGHSSLRWIHPDDRQLVIDTFQAQLDNPTAAPPQVEFRVLSRDGRVAWFESRPHVVRDPATGEITSIADVARDVTERKRLHAELVAARDAAEAAAKVKADFMANMSHEIRTPLTAILGYTSLVAARADLADDARFQVDRIATAGQALLALVNDVLDFSKLEAGQMPLKPRPAAPAEAFSEAIALFEPQAESKGIRLRLEVEGALPDQVSVDADRLRQILLNLVGNAVKFTEAGEVVVSCAYDEAAEQLVARVRDSGPGMNAEQQEKLFQRFSQVDASTTRRHGGTGLGLAICRGLVEAMGGALGVESAPGRGSTFWFRVHAPVCQEVAEEVEAVGFDLSGVRVLVADDNRINRELTRALLEPYGAEVAEAVDGLSAVETALALPFDVILMDVRMPGMDGPDATLRIRAQPGPNRGAPILAFSADYDVERLGLQAGRGFSGYVRKPLNAHELLAAVADAAASQPEAGAYAAVQPPSTV